ncbi:MAG: alpha-amylase [Flavobacterium sp. BFFFF2]|nr:MAG: alpha-amylase [Flavobacterium sp. BFFFF2]
MKKNVQQLLLGLLWLLPLCGFSQVTTSPTTFEATGMVTINLNKAGTPLAAYTGDIYAHIGVTTNNANWQSVIGTWGNNATQKKLTFVSGTTYKLDIAPSLYTYFGVPTTTSITKICVVFRTADASKQTTDYFIPVGAFQASLTSPVLNSTTLLTQGQSISVAATNTGGAANYTLLANGVSINTSTGATYAFTDSNIMTNKSYELQVNIGIVTFSFKFLVLVDPLTQSVAMANGVQDGINYGSDPTKATLVLTAPGKDYVYVSGSFNSWNPDASYAMKKDPTSGKFWLDLTNLVAGQQYTYQYWVVDQTPTTNSPKLVKTGDPYSTLVLSPFDDPYIPSASYPNLPTFPAGQEREVTVLQTGQTAYPWSNATLNFNKPSKENLVIYEVLIRDFDSGKSYQNLIDRIDYFKSLKINAIELMPVMEYEGNESWGYNTSFHMALDKYYGTEDKFKEFIDKCHQNGIAVILDIALNHAFGRNPMVRMWMKDADADGWGDPASDNPYFNEFSKHSYGVGSDFNHSSALTKYYVKRVVQHWINDFKIDGFRWDLTKGFTQACSSGNDACTNSYLQDRVDILKTYADYSWAEDPTHYVIFEHLGIDSEEQQWANYRISETPSKGVMMWGELYDTYKQLEMGYSSNANFTRMGHVSRGFSAQRLIGYAESHDKDRVAYQGKTFGATTGGSPVGGNTINAIKRMSALGAVSLLVPGPKMIWHFAELGMDDSIYTCTDNTVNTETDATTGDCKLATKPQKQWTQNYPADPNRSVVYSNYSRMIDMKTSNLVFSSSYAISSSGGNLLYPRIYLWNDNIPSNQLKNVVVLANFSTDTAIVTPDFPYVGTWYNLMDNSSLNVTSTSAGISIEAGGFRIFGNVTATLSNNEVGALTSSLIQLYPNPTESTFQLNVDANQVDIYSITGQLVRSYQQTNTSTVFSISDLNSGLYLVRVTDSNQAQNTLKLVKK